MQRGFHFLLALDNGRQRILLSFKTLDRSRVGVIARLRLAQASMLGGDNPVL